MARDMSIAESWALGNIRELEGSPVGDCEFQWMERYGASHRLSGGFGVSDILILPFKVSYTYSRWKYS